MIVKNTIVDLLNHLIKDHCGLSWKMGTGLHNGKGVSIYEILIFEIKNNKTIGKIAFNGETGRLLNLHVAGYTSRIADNVIDALLDITNYLRKYLK